MASTDRRSRSNTSMSTRSRPQSRASTASAQSLSAHDSQHFYAQQQPQPNYYQPFNPPHSHVSLQPALIQAAQQAGRHDNIEQRVAELLGTQGGDVAHHHVPHTGQFPQHMNMHNQQHSYQPTLSQPQPPQPSYTPPIPEVEEKKKKGAAAGNATNDKELREMLSRNQGRRLKDVAAEVIATDRTARAEKSKQLFAMIWLKSSCQTARTSVPRNRVYSKYAERCGTERVIPLNPASFGKLVRVIFPGIQTRRLGVRGESKYHYVDLGLIESDEGEDVGRPSTGYGAHNSLKRHSSSGPKLDFNSIPRLPADSAAFPPQDQTFQSSSSYFSQGTSKGSLFTQFDVSRFHPSNSRTSSMYEYELKFPTPEHMAALEDLHITLPDMNPYLPPRTDSDSADALFALYRTHCTSLIDSVRYCKEKQFFRLFTSFHGTLTVPVQKLFAAPELAPWIKECDWMMYQKMVRNIAQITLQTVPPVVLKFLNTVANTLHQHLSKVFHCLPVHVLEAKLEPATVFAHLIRQMLRVNEAAHAASRILTNDENRNQMWDEWCTWVYPSTKRIIENELPHSCGHEEVFNMLTTEIRGLLLPLRPQLHFPNTPLPAPDAAVEPGESVIDRFAALYNTLPTRFPHVPARTLLHCMNAVTSAAMRELTVNNATSFTWWWLVKVFMDELGQWRASLGGFLNHSPPSWESLTYSPELMGESMNTRMTNGASGSNNESRYSSLDAEFGANQSFTAVNGNGPVQGPANEGQENNVGGFSGQYDHMNFNLNLHLANPPPQQEASHDDSGIGLLEENLDSKFATSVQQSLKPHLTSMPHGVS